MNGQTNGQKYLWTNGKTKTIYPWHSGGIIKQMCVGVAAKGPELQKKFFLVVAGEDYHKNRNILTPEKNSAITLKLSFYK